MSIPAPYDYQTEGIDMIIDNRVSYLQDEQGLGKSRQVIDAFTASCQLGAVISIHPLSVIYVMEREIEKWQPGHWHIRVWRHKQDINTDDLKTPGVWVIMPWSLLSNMSPAKQRSIASHTLAGCWVDEAHYAKTWGAKRTGAAMAIATAARKVVLTSGTPMPNNATELGPILNAFWPADLDGATNHHQWMVKSCLIRERMYNGHKTWQIIKSKASVLNKLRKRHAEVGDWMRRTKDAVLPQLPDRTWTQVPMESTAELMAEVGDLLRAEGIDPSDDQAAWSTLRRMLGMAKVSFAADYINELMDGGADKVLVFCHHRDVIEDMVRALDGSHRDILTLYGNTPDKHREMFERRWNFPGGPRLAVCQMDAAGTGLTLHADGQCCNSVFVETTTVPGTLAQAADRTHRIGQPNPVNNHLIVVRSSIDDRMMQRVLSKLMDIEVLTGDRAVSLHGEVN